jgi:dihydroorotase
MSRTLPELLTPAVAWTIDADKISSKSRNTPFDGWKVCGRAAGTIVDGVWRYRNGDIV